MARRIAPWVGTAVVLGAIVVVWQVLGVGLFHILTGSMRPSIDPYDVVVTTPQPTYSVGDIIVFQTDQQGVVTHRIVKVGEHGFITQGDANKSVDSWEIPPNRVVGKKAFVVPRIGAWFHSEFWQDKVRQPRTWAAPILWGSAFLVYWFFIRERPQRGQHRM